MSFPSCRLPGWLLLLFLLCNRYYFDILLQPCCGMLLRRPSANRSPPLDGNWLKMESRRLPLSNLRVHNFSIGPMTWSQGVFAHEKTKSNSVLASRNALQPPSSVCGTRPIHSESRLIYILRVCNIFVLALSFLKQLSSAVSSDC